MINDKKLIHVKKTRSTGSLKKGHSKRKLTLFKNPMVKLAISTFKKPLMMIKQHSCQDKKREKNEKTWRRGEVEAGAERANEASALVGLVFLVVDKKRSLRAAASWQ